MTRRANEPVALIVEREGPARELAAEFLRSVEWRVEFATDGALGWERVQKTRLAMDAKAASNVPVNEGAVWTNEFFPK